MPLILTVHGANRETAATRSSWRPPTATSSSTSATPSPSRPSYYEVPWNPPFGIPGLGLRTVFATGSRRIRYCAHFPCLERAILPPISRHNSGTSLKRKNGGTRFRETNPCLQRPSPCLHNLTTLYGFCETVPACQQTSAMIAQ